jgi:anti-anti-sigma factor
MNIEIYAKGCYQILKFKEDLAVISDLSELKFLIEGYLGQGKRHIAVNFPSAAYIYSGAIAVLVDTYKKIRNEKGVLCIIEPNEDILGILRFLNLDKLITICKSEDDLPAVEG